MDSEMQITADEINCLIYAYLQDSGFEHSSYALRTEARLDLSPNAKTPIPRGELVDLLSKALLYTEVEAHWKLDKNASNCTETFSLLTPHTCHVHQTRQHNSPDPMPASPRHELFPLPQTNGNNHDSGSTTQKRKASLELFNEARPEKRICVGNDVDMRIEEAEEHHPISEQSITTNSSTNRDAMVQDMEVFFAPTEPPPPRPPVIKTEEPMSPVVLLQGHDAEVFSAAWNPAFPDLLATGSKDATVRVWSWDDISRANIRNYLSPDMSFPIPPSGSQYLRPNPITLRHHPKSDQPDITSLDWNSEGTLLATGSYDRLLRIWRKTGEPYMTQIYHSGPIFSVQFSKSGKWLLSASLDGTAIVWDVATKGLQMEFKVHTSCLDVDWLDESAFVTCSADYAIHLVSLSSKEAVRTFVGHTNEVNQVKFNKHRTILASCSDDNTARVWLDDSWTNSDGSIANPDNGLSKEELATRYPAKFVLSGHTHPVGAIQWCPAPLGTVETLLATCSFDGAARLWEASKGTCLRVFTDNTKSLFSITFSPEGRFVAAGSEDGYLYIYNTATGNRVWRWPDSGPGAAPIYDVKWQKLGNGRLAMCMKSKIVGIVDTAKIPELAHHFDAI
ncbi:WD40 repeat-like protein [Hysterangium stoloniferum]|nr:WD40 repeat-like protein [Hysterangium stoloniferum]